MSVMSKKMRLYTVYYTFVNCSTCFGWLLHPSSGSHLTVITASGTGQTVFATFRYRGDVGTSSVITIICAPDNGWNNYPKQSSLQKYNKLYILQKLYITEI
jgi:hypothetical protein